MRHAGETPFPAEKVGLLSDMPDYRLTSVNDTPVIRPKGDARCLWVEEVPRVADMVLVPLSDVEELEWQERALCAQTDPEAFFPE